MPPKTKKRSATEEGTAQGQVPPKKKRKTADKKIQHLVMNGTTRRRNVTKIRQNRFRNSSILETVQIDDDSGINCIEWMAFEGCRSLQSVHLGSVVTTIEGRAFQACRSLQSVHLAGGIESIEKWTFKGCTSLQSICIPETVMVIKNYAFHECKSLHTIQIPENVTTIEYGAFHGCSSLRTIQIPENVTTIGNCPFYNCTSLQSIDIPNSVTIIPCGAFINCSSLKSINLPNTVTEIAANAFDRCSSLMSVNIPIGVTKIGPDAFFECSSLRSIYIPNSVKTIGCDAFRGCDTLEERLKNGTNYHSDTATWLRRRFDNLPIHRACYYANDDDAQSTVDLSTLVRDNHQALAATDAMDMTPLHILCCNPRVTAEMMQLVVENDPSLLTHTDVTGETPLQLFLECRRVLGGEQRQETMQSLCEGLEKGTIELQQEENNLAILFVPNGDNNDMNICLLEKGKINGEDWSILSILTSHQQQLIDLSGRDGNTNLFPFMSAAASPACGLDVVYALAMENLDAIV